MLSENQNLMQDSEIFKVFNLTTLQKIDSYFEPEQGEKMNFQQQINDNQSIEMNMSSDLSFEISQINIDQNLQNRQNTLDQFITLETIEILKANNKCNEIKEQFPQFDISQFLNQENKNEIIFNNLIKHLSDEYCFQVENKIISFFSTDAGQYITCRPYPFYETILIQEWDYIQQKCLKLKFEEVENYLYHEILFGFKNQNQLENEKIEDHIENKSCFYTEQPDLNNKIQNKKIQKKVKTRKNTIGYIAEQVSRWRQLSNYGKKDNTNMHSLDDAALIVKIQRKTLDDYFLQIKKGKKLGFDFNKYANEKIGVLRKFNQEKSIEKNQAFNEK